MTHFKKRCPASGFENTDGFLVNWKLPRKLNHLSSPLPPNVPLHQGSIVFASAKKKKNESSLKTFRLKKLPTVPMQSHNLRASIAVPWALCQRSEEQTKGEDVSNRKSLEDKTLYILNYEAT